MLHWCDIFIGITNNAWYYFTALYYTGIHYIYLNLDLLHYISVNSTLFENWLSISCYPKRLLWNANVRYLQFSASYPQWFAVSLLEGIKTVLRWEECSVNLFSLYRTPFTRRKQNYLRVIQSLVSALGHLHGLCLIWLSIETETVSTNICGQFYSIAVLLTPSESLAWKMCKAVDWWLRLGI